MAPARRKGRGAAAVAAAAVAAAKWKVGDLVLAKMKGFPAWPAMISEPEKWGLPATKKKLLVYFYGTKQVAFCNYADIEAFTEEKRKSLVLKRQGKSADFVRAVDEIIEISEARKSSNGNVLVVACDDAKFEDENTRSPNGGSCREYPENSLFAVVNNKMEPHTDSDDCHEFSTREEPSTVTLSERCIVNSADVPVDKLSILDDLRQTSFSSSSLIRRKRQRDPQTQNCYTRTRLPSLQRLRDNITLPQDSGDPSNLPESTNYNTPIDVVTEDHDALNKADGDDKCFEEIHSRVTNDANNVNTRGFVEQSLHKEGFEATCLENEVKLDGLSDISVNTVIFRRKRKPNRKRLNNSTDFSCEDSYLEADLPDVRVESPSSRNEVHKSGGDEHLPLVKRARVRMGRPLTDENRTVEQVSGRISGKLECENPEVKHVGHDTSSVEGNGCLAAGMFCEVKTQSSSPLMDSSAVTRSPSGKSEESEQKAHTLDVEAALPPSKRLHRALEAMSANAVDSVENGHHNFEECTPLDTSGDNLRSPLPTDMSIDSRHAISESLAKSDIMEATDYTDKCGPEESTVQNSQIVPVTEVRFEDGPDDPKGVGSEAKMDRNVGEASSVQNSANIDNNGRTWPCSDIKINGHCANGTSSESVADELSSSLNKSKENEVLRPSATAQCSEDKNGNKVAEACRTKSLKVGRVSESFSNCDRVSIEGATSIGYTTSDSSGTIRSPSMQSDAQTRTFEMHTCPAVIPKDVSHKLLQKDIGFSPDSKPMKDLIAAAQAKRLLSRSASLLDHHLDAKPISESLSNSSHGNVRASGIVFQQQFDKLTVQDEDNMVLKNFENSVVTLTRTKESIARATRFAMECAKFGIAGEVIDIIVENLDKESNLPKRVDLFFLVDSIAQCCRSQKGGPGDVYPSLIESVLPRILCAAAPPGNSAWENRRQCLKVLKLWLERKILPEYIIRHHIRELNSFNEAAFSSCSSRRPSRTERALNDPLRENEGMLVDEYGSNAGFQIPDLLSTKVLDDGEGSSSEERSFEAVTPEWGAEAGDEVKSALTCEKHHQVLEEVDGELEMEDVAPSCEARPVSATEQIRADLKRVLLNKDGVDSIPPLPNDRPPSPPPLPSSPPPLLPTCFAGPHQLPLNHAPDQNLFEHEPHKQAIRYNDQSQQQIHSGMDFAGSTNSCMVPPHSAQYQSLRYDEPLNRMPSPMASFNPAELHGNFSAPGAMHSGNNSHPMCGSMPNNSYYVRPPPPLAPNQYPYIQPEPVPQRAQPWGNGPSYHERSHYDIDDRGHCYGDRDVWGPFPHENAERGRHSPYYNREHQYPDMFDGPPPYHRPPSGPSYYRQGWSMHPRRCNFSFPTSRQAMASPTSRPSRGRHMEPFSRVNRARGNWRP